MTYEQTQHDRSEILASLTLAAAVLALGVAPIAQAAEQRVYTNPQRAIVAPAADHGTKLIDVTPSSTQKDQLVIRQHDHHTASHWQKNFVGHGFVEGRISTTQVLIDPKQKLTGSDPHGDQLDANHTLVRLQRLHAGLTAKPAQVIRNPLLQHDATTQRQRIEPAFIIRVPDHAKPMQRPERKVKPEAEPMASAK